MRRFLKVPAAPHVTILQLAICAALTLVLTLLPMAWSSSTRAEVVLDVGSDGRLWGAKNVSILGALYDVEFKDGTCIALFNGCDIESDFAFHTLEDASEAAQALLEQVFLDGPLESFDSDPTLTNGCSSVEVCRSHIPYGLFRPDGGVDFADALNRPVLDSVSSGGRDTFADLTTVENSVYAIFFQQPNPPATDVGEPPFGLAFIVTALTLELFRRRRR